MNRVLLRVRTALTASAGIIAALFFYAFHATATLAAIILMLGVLLAGAYNKPPVGITVSFVSAVVLDYFFIPPIEKVTIARLDGWVACIAFLGAAIFATRLSASLKQQRDELVLRESEAERFHALNRSMLLTEHAEEIPRLIVNRCIELFGFAESALFQSDQNRTYRSHTNSVIADDELKRSAVNGSFFQNTENEVAIVPVTLGNNRLGSFGFRGKVLPTSTLQTLSNTIAIGLAQARAQDARNKAEAVWRGEELKSVMLDALAHELKTPLTAIEASADILLHSQISTQQSRDLLEVIEQSSKGLTSLLSEAIHMARIDAKKLKLERQALSVGEAIEAAIASLGERIVSQRISMQMEAELPDVYADRDLLIQVLKQLLDNAVKYSPSRSLIIVAAAFEPPETVMIAVRDQGMGLTEHEQGRVFDKFYRGRYDNSAIQGTGMGLAIAKEIMEAHGGSINVQSQVGRGSEFRIVLRAAAHLYADLKR
jgi:two-component system sensor histidine kinase KdpD